MKDNILLITTDQQHFEKYLENVEGDLIEGL